ncbi:MAG: glycosyltransferase [Riemerella sp.]|nr:glycosyltransferase [Riemerella sp.]
MYSLPLISVVMITYRHEKYIQKAIEGVFLQKTNFPIEFIIANDNSPDNTDNIIKQVIKNTPDNVQVRYTKHEVNKGMNPNFTWALKQAKGKYIAICDGDDYWIDENKLQKQVDFLEQNPNYAICCHNVYFLNGETISSQSPYDKENTQDTYTLDDLASKNMIPTLSVVFHNLNINFPNWYYSSPMGDYPLFLWTAKSGKIKYFKEKMGVYRQNTGVWSGKQKDYTKIISVFENLLPDFENFPTTKKLLKEHKNKYIKLYLRVLPLKQILKSKYFSDLNFIDKTKVILRKLL